MTFTLNDGQLPTTQLMDLLRWVGGANERVPDWIADQKADRAVAVLDAHRVVGRAARLAEGSILEGSRFHQRLTAEQQTVASWNSQMERALSAFIERFCGDLDVGILKGNTHYYNSGDASTMRYTGDVDLIVDKPTVLRDRILTAGLTSSVINARYPTHEYGSAELDGVHFDLHKFIPVWKRAPLDRPWRERSTSLDVPDRILEDRISLHGIMQTGHQEVLGRASLWIPSVALAAFITIGAAHRDFVMHCASHLEGRPSVRLSDVCEVRDAFDHVDFDSDEFVEILRFFENDDQIEWFDALLIQFAGDERLGQYFQEACGRALPHRRSVYRLVASAFWTHFRADPARDALGSLDSGDLFDLNPALPVSLVQGSATQVRMDVETAGVRPFRTLGGMRPDGRTFQFGVDPTLLTICFPLGAEVTDLTTIYAEFDGEMIQWDNVLDVKRFDIFAATEGSRAWLTAFSVEKNVVTIKLRAQDGKLPERLALSVTVPQLPWSAYAGWIGLFHLHYGK